MDSESVYTNDEITKVAEEVAESIVNASDLMMPYLIKAEQWQEGPLAMFSMWSNKYNPLGKFAIEVETLTMAQKGIVVRIVGNAMTRPGSGI